MALKQAYSPAEIQAAIAQYESAERATASTPAEDVEAYRQQVAVDVFHSLVHGIRLTMRSDEEAGDFAERLFNLHAELMNRATNAGIIPPLEPK